MMNRIQQMRKRMGLSQRQLGDAMQVSQSAISAWEAGRNEPDYTSLRKMAEILECGVEYLMGYGKEDNVRYGLSEEAFQAKQRQYQEEKKRREMEAMEENKDFDPELEAEIRNEEIANKVEKTHHEIFWETAEIDRIFDENNVQERDRQKAVKMLKIWLEN